MAAAIRIAPSANPDPVMPSTSHDSAMTLNWSPSSDTLSPNQTSRKSRPASGREERRAGRPSDRAGDGVDGGHSIEIRTPSPSSSTSRIEPLMPASIASRIRSEVASEMPGTWLIAARPSDSGMRRLMTVRPASVTWTRSDAGRARPAARSGPSPRASRSAVSSAARRLVEGVQDRAGLRRRSAGPRPPVAGPGRRRRQASGTGRTGRPTTSSGCGSPGPRIEGLEPTAGLRDVDLAPLERAQDAQPCVLVGRRDGAVGLRWVPDQALRRRVARPRSTDRVRPAVSRRRDRRGRIPPSRSDDPQVAGHRTECRRAGSPLPTRQRPMAPAASRSAVRARTRGRRSAWPSRSRTSPAGARSMSPLTVSIAERPRPEQAGRRP